MPPKKIPSSIVPPNKATPPAPLKKTLEEKYAPDQPIKFTGDLSWKDVHAAYVQLLNQILNQSQIINYQYKRLLAVEMFIKDLKSDFEFDDEELKILEEMVEHYGLDKELFTESESPVQ